MVQGKTDENRHHHHFGQTCIKLDEVDSFLLRERVG